MTKILQTVKVKRSPNATSMSPTDAANANFAMKQEKDAKLMDLLEGFDGYDRNKRYAPYKEIDYNNSKHTATYMNYTLLESANPPPSAKYQHPSTHRIGNNSDVDPHMRKYINPEGINYGPFEIRVNHQC